MQAGETVGTEQFGGLTTLDAMRWLLAILIVGVMGAGGWLLARDWTPPAGEIVVAEPAILLELAPMPEPEVQTPEPVIEPDPEPTPLHEVQPEPLVEPPPPDQLGAQPEPEPEPKILPEPVEEPAQEALPAPLPEPRVPDVAMPMPVTMSAALLQKRKATAPSKAQAPRATPRPNPSGPTQQVETPRPAAQQAAPQPSQPAVASGPSPAEWQAQVLRHIDRRKVYPRDAQRAGQEGVVTIAFTIDASGRVLAVSVARSSGFPGLDQAALDTAWRASPVPRPPGSLGNNISLAASIRFAIR